MPDFDLKALIGSTVMGIMMLCLVWSFIVEVIRTLFGGN